VSGRRRRSTQRADRGTPGPQSAPQVRGVPQCLGPNGAARHGRAGGLTSIRAGRGPSAGLPSGTRPRTRRGPGTSLAPGPRHGRRPNRVPAAGPGRGAHWATTTPMPSSPGVDRPEAARPPRLRPGDPAPPPSGRRGGFRRTSTGSAPAVPGGTGRQFGQLEHLGSAHHVHSRSAARTVAPPAQFGRARSVDPHTRF